MHPIPRLNRGPKRATNVSISDSVISEARALRINVSRACEWGLAYAVREAKAARWTAENADGFTAWNDQVEQHGVPLAKYRKF